MIFGMLIILKVVRLTSESYGEPRVVKQYIEEVF
jgi:hypothetical protein